MPSLKYYDDMYIRHCSGWTIVAQLTCDNPVLPTKVPNAAALAILHSSLAKEHTLLAVAVPECDTHLR